MSSVRQKRCIRIEVAKRIVKQNLSSKRFKSASPDAISEMFDSAPSEGESIELTTEEDFEDDDCDNSLDLNSQDDHEQHSCFEYESCWAHSDVTMMPVETQVVNAVGVEVSSDKFLPLSLHNALEENSVTFDSTFDQDTGDVYSVSGASNSESCSESHIDSEILSAEESFVESTESCTTTKSSDTADSYLNTDSDLETSLNEYTSGSSSSMNEVSDDQDDQDDQEFAAGFLFNQATVSTKEFCVAMLSMFYKHSLTYSSLTYILKLLVQVLPSPNSLPHSTYILINKFVDYNANVIVHHCCGFCTRLLSDGNPCSQVECQSNSLTNFSFVEVRLDKQLERIFSGTSMHMHDTYIYIYIAACMCVCMYVYVCVYVCMCVHC